MKFYKGTTEKDGEEWIAVTKEFNVDPVQQDNDYVVIHPNGLAVFADADFDTVRIQAMDHLFADGWVTVKEVADERADEERQSRSHFAIYFNFFDWDIATAAHDLNTSPENIKNWISGEIPPQAIQKKIQQIWYQHTYGQSIAQDR